jgi:membrane peptidoglycan carboxypeptidase
MIKKMVVWSEDPNFFNHAGLDENAIKWAVIGALQSGVFYRGGSTIAQQIIKNVFLSPERTLVRKAEEAFLVWLLYNTGIVTREKLLELYINLIEWGPDRFGLAEAAAFYFNKRPYRLTFQEVIFLAKIISHPRSFAVHFDAKGKLRESDYEYWRYHCDLFKKEQIISPDYDCVKMNPEVNLSGEAKYYLQTHRNVGLDSVKIEEDVRPGKRRD